jgi:hypothetical protein
MPCFYVQGPSPNTVVENLTDFFALELDEGKLKYYLNFGDQTQIGSILEVSSTLILTDPNSQSRPLKRSLLELTLPVCL